MYTRRDLTDDTNIKFQPVWELRMKSDHFLTISFSIATPYNLESKVHSAQCIILGERTNHYKLQSTDQYGRMKFCRLHEIEFNLSFSTKGIYDTIFNAKSIYNYIKHCQSGFKYKDLPIEIEFELNFDCQREYSHTLTQRDNYICYFSESLITFGDMIDDPNTQTIDTKLKYTCKNVFIGFDPIFNWVKEVKKILNKSCFNLHLFTNIIFEYINLEMIKIKNIDNYNYLLWDELQKYKSLMNINLYDTYKKLTQYQSDWEASFEHVQSISGVEMFHTMDGDNIDVWYKHEACKINYFDNPCKIVNCPMSFGLDRYYCGVDIMINGRLWIERSINFTYQTISTDVNKNDIFWLVNCSLAKQKENWMNENIEDGCCEAEKIHQEYKSLVPLPRNRRRKNNLRQNYSTPCCIQDECDRMYYQRKNSKNKWQSKWIREKFYRFKSDKINQKDSFKTQRKYKCRNKRKLRNCKESKKALKSARTFKDMIY